MIIALTVTGFVAVVIAALGLLSLATDSDVIETPGLGPLPGVIGVAAVTGMLIVVLARVLRVPQPSYLAALWSGVAAYVVYVVAVAVAAIVGGTDPAVAVSAAGGLAIRWPGPTVALCAAGTVWIAVALRRTRGARPRWPWEELGEP